MDPPAADRVVLVTGANSGIGLATVLEVARRGFRTVATVRSVAKARGVRAAARAAGVRIATVQLDVTDAEACRKVVARVRPWGLVNNAGTSFTGAVEDVGDDEARRAFEVMVLAPMRLARLSVPHMRAAGGGRIVNLSSIYGIATTPLSGWYQAAKHALEAVSDALRAEVARDGIAVVLVEPGGFRTGIWGEADDDLGRRTDSRYDAAYRRTRFGIRLTDPLLGSPERVARVIGDALVTRRPKPRYLVGLDAMALGLATRFVPAQAWDLVTRRALGL